MKKLIFVLAIGFFVFVSSLPVDDDEKFVKDKVVDSEVIKLEIVPVPTDSEVVKDETIDPSIDEYDESLFTDDDEVPDTFRIKDRGVFLAWKQKIRDRNQGEKI